jgi:AmmeMemoRadiSam system protein A
MLTTEERASLLEFARRTIHAHLTRSEPPLPVALREPMAHSGAFVTLHHGHDLRGCIGYPGSDRRLDEVIGQGAIAAATEDPRFRSVTASELPRLTIEISVLTPIVPVQDVAEIEVGRDGLVIQDGYHKGLLLPQVATEYGWDRETLLAHTCLKAGLDRHAWKLGAKIMRFQAEVFSEGKSA